MDLQNIWAACTYLFTSENKMQATISREDELRQKKKRKPKLSGVLNLFPDVETVDTWNDGGGRKKKAVQLLANCC